MVSCGTQEEIDHYWEKLSAVPEAEQCGWLKDKYGLSWQVVPSDMDEMMRKGTPGQMARVTQAFLKMKKFDLAAIRSLRRRIEGGLFLHGQKSGDHKSPSVVFHEDAPRPNPAWACRTAAPEPMSMTTPATPARIVSIHAPRAPVFL
jgi:hypothetical protein